MKQKSANHQSNKETLKFNGQFVRACFNLVFFFFNGNNAYVIKITLASKKPLRFSPLRQTIFSLSFLIFFFFVKPQNISKRGI